jgi:hypothetical protein
LLSRDLEGATLEEDVEPTVEMVSQEVETLSRLKKAIELLEAAGDNDPKLGLVLKYLRAEGWVDRGYIMFSQYLDTVMWIAGHLASAFAENGSRRAVHHARAPAPFGCATGNGIFSEGGAAALPADERLALE